MVLIIKEHNENKYIVGYYTINSPIDIDEIFSYIKKYLPSYMIPYKLLQIDNMPYNQNGKIDRNLLKKMNEEEM